MRVLVTGATGFVGGRVARLLCAEGHDVRATGLPGDPTDVLESLDCDYRAADLLDGVVIDELVQGVEAVFHVAALVTFDPRRYDKQWQVNVGGTQLLLDAAGRAGVGRFVYTSTVNTLGIPALGQVGDEDTPFDWARWGLGYMDSKRAAEESVLAHELDTVCVLPGTMFGPGDIFFSAGTYIREAARGRLVLAPPGGTTVAHVDDVAQGHLLALERGRPGARYALGGDHLSYETLYRVINEELGRPGPYGVIPESLLRFTGRQSDGLRRLGLAIPWSEGLAVAGSAPLYYSSRLAESELGYRPRPAIDGIREAIAWYRQRRMIYA
ncbi:MAG: NAD-dependent epimerase/dehydratase family protein [bacterium]